MKTPMLEFLHCLNLTNVDVDIKATGSLLISNSRTKSLVDYSQNAYSIYTPQYMNSDFFIVEKQVPTFKIFKIFIRHKI